VEGDIVSDIDIPPHEVQEDETKTVVKLGASFCAIYCTLGAGIIAVSFLIIWGPHYWGFLWGITWLLAIVCIVAGTYVARYSWEKAEKASRW
jgi:hypothetical protein